MLNIGAKLGLGIAVLLSLCLLIGWVSYTQNREVREKIQDITQVSEPVNSAVHALENNLVETAFATVGYLSTGDTILLQTLDTTRSRSILLQQKFAALSEIDKRPDDEEKIRDGFARIHRSAEEQIRLRDLQLSALDQLFKALDSTDVLLTARLKSSVSIDDSAAYRRLQTVLDMEVSITAMTKAVGNFLLTGNADFERRLQEAEGDFNRVFTTYRYDLLTPDEKHWVEQLSFFSRESFRLARVMIGLDKDRRKELSAFLALETEFSSTLFNRIQSRTEVNLERSKLDVVEAGSRANIRVLLVLMISIAFGIGAGVVTTRSITGPIRELSLAMQAIAGGDEALKVTLRSGGELRTLGEAFNLMTGRLLQAIESLRESELRFRTMFEDAPIGIALADDAGRLIQTNPALREMLGSSESELSEYALFGKVRGISDGNPASPETPSRFQQEINIPSKDGRIGWASVNVSPMHAGPGRPPCSILMMEDITARRITETRIRMLAQTITSLNESVIITDSKNVIMSVNHAFTSIYGYPEEEVVGKDLELLRLHDETGLATPSLKEKMRTGKWSGELMATRKGGEEFPVQFSTSLVRDDSGIPVAIVSISRDITDRIRMQHQLQAAEHRRLSEIRSFAGSVQRAQEEERARISRELHDDLCQRLTGMKFAAETIADGMRPTNKKVIRTLREFAGDLDNAISEVRRMSSNLRPSVLDDFGLATALKLLCKEFDASHPVKTTCEVTGTAPRHVDPNIEIAVFRMAQEALSNIAKHSGASTARLKADYRKSNLRLTIEDDGKGFAAGPGFHQREGGHGLGLIGMRERTELLGGLFEITSAPDQGTTVSVTVPFKGTSGHEEDTNPHRG